MSERTVLDVGTAKQLFADDELIDSMVDVFQVLNPGRKHPQNPLIVRDRPWEGATIDAQGSFLYDPLADVEDRFRLWYSCSCGGEWEEDKDYAGLLLAKSSNGIEWEKPALGVANINGLTDNNAVWVNNSRGWHGICGFSYDPVEEDSARRFKALGFMGTDKPKVTRSGWGAFFSPDGIHWSEYENNPVLGDYDHVTLCEVLETIYNEQSKNPRPGHPLDRHRYYGSGKYSSWMCPPVQDRNEGFMRRTAGLRTSEDFINWSENHLILQPDEIDDFLARRRIMATSPMLRANCQQDNRSEFYGMGLMPYGDILFGLLWIYEACGWGKTDASDGFKDGPVYLQLVGTRDLRRWKRLGERMALLDVGAAGQWDCGVVYPTNRPVVVGDEIWLYYGGSNLGHGGHVEEPDVGSGIGLATWRLDGFVSINANKYPGKLTTKPLKFSGRRLVINYSTTSAGSIRVEVLGQDGTAIAGYSIDDCRDICGDDIEHAVRWTSCDDVSGLAGREIRLQFTMTHAKLFSFRFVH